MGIVRFLLALSVMLEHLKSSSNTKMLDGFMAVQIFFILSGFYIFKTLSENYSTSNIDIKKFYFNRFLRLYPTYWIVFGITIIWSVYEHYFYSSTPNKLAPYIFFVPHFNALETFHIFFSNLFLIGLDIYHFVGIDANRHLYFTMQQVQTQELVTVGPAWSLAPEIYFYILSPWLVKCRKWILAIFIIASLLLRILVYQKLGSPIPIESIYRFFPFEIALFLMGGLAYKFSSSIKITSSIGLVTFSAMPMAVLCAIPFHLDYKSCWILYVVVILCLVFSNFQLPNRLLKLDTLLGQFSFPIYIAHYLVLNVALAIFHQHNLVVCITLVSMLCIPLWLFQNYLSKNRDVFWLKLFTKKLEQ